MKVNRILIITGGAISPDFVKEYLDGQEFNIVIAVDSGLVTARELLIPIHYIVGDFDSVPRELIEYYRAQETAVVIKEYNPMKDLTDTHIAIDLSMELKCDELVILGATGSRMDHMLANIHLLYLPLNKNIKASIIDEHNKIYLINQNMTIEKSKLHGPYISLIPFTEEVTEVTLKGFKYPLVKHTMHIGDSLGVSNEVVSERADIELKQGTLVVIEAKD